MKFKTIMILLVFGFLFVTGCSPEIKGICNSNGECIDGFLCDKEKHCVEVEQEQLQIMVENLPDGILNEEYSYTISVQGGLKPYLLSVGTSLDWLSYDEKSHDGTFKLSGDPSEKVTGVAVELIVNDNTVGDGQTATKNLTLDIVYCSLGKNTVCSGHGTCSDDDLCTCNPGYAGMQCELCAEGHQLNDQQECVRYEFQCTGTECGAEVQQRICLLDNCDSWTTVKTCEADQLCVVETSEAKCMDCTKGCKQGACIQCDQGPCCDPNGQFYPSTHQTHCATWDEYQCDGFICGGLAQARVVSQFCSGDTADCTGQINEPQWVDLETCEAGLICETNETTYAQCISCPQVQVCHFNGGCTQGEKKWSWDSPNNSESQFGQSLSIGGEHILVGAPYDPGPGSTDKIGASYILRFNGETWENVKQLNATTPKADARFGYSVSTDGNRIIVGAPWEKSDTVEPVSVAGAAYIFERNEWGAWKDGIRLALSSPEYYDHFGYSVAIEGDLAVVGAYGVGGQSDPTDSPGMAFAYERDPESGVWSMVKQIQAPDEKRGNNFGYSADISAGTIIIGATQMYATEGKGAAYVYQQDSPGVYSYITTLQDGEGTVSDQFGSAVAIFEDYAVVATNAQGEGAVCIFHRSGTGAWDNGIKIKASDIKVSSGFGRSVAITRDRVLIGSPNEEGAYLFQRTDTNSWQYTNPYTAPSVSVDNNYGSAVGLDNDFVVIGASGEDIRGAVYIY